MKRQIRVEESKYRVTGDPRDLILIFWDPLHILGTVIASNVKFRKKDSSLEVLTKEMQKWVKRGQEGVTKPTFEILGPPPYLENGWS